MAAEWDEVMLWALAEKLSERMDAIREEKERASVPPSGVAPITQAAGNVIDASARFSSRR